MSEITNLVDQMIVKSLKEAEKVDFGTDKSDFILKDVRQLVTFKMEMEKMDLALKQFETKTKHDEEELKIRRDELAYKIKYDKENLDLRREELNQKRDNDNERLMLEKLRSLREKLEKEYQAKNQNRNEIAKITVDLVKTLLVCVGTAKVASGVLAVEEVGVVRSKAFPLIGNLLGRIR